ncbi:MAG TPA: cysteine--tRNA ligase, partial [Candidatus Paceibacterota bacterium]|nr:cysteine--tRNA ligase [Candidatus Paceibacterota bacterium]
MALKGPINLYNTLTRKVEVFKPIKKTAVGLYTCGPTVYNYAHLGNFRSFLFEDLLERVLVWNGYAVKRVMNITDVGHLTGDSDAGEDKVDREARAERKSVNDIVKFYTKAFLSDAKKLNIRMPKLLAPASKFIPEQQKIVKELFKKGLAYDTPSAVYFDVGKFPNYGKLSGQSLEEKLTGARGEVVTDKEKRNAADFALWFKLTGKFEHHLLHWPSPWGEGFPGWHIECSAISTKFLGQPFDIHTGGVDHIGTHHTNEIAQSEAAYGKPLAHYWLHGEFFLVDATKMAKSAGNFLTLKDIEEKSIPPLVFRYLTLMTHYRTPMNFSWVALDQAKNAFANLIQKILFVEYMSRDVKKQPTEAVPEIGAYRERFRAAVAADLNVPKALGILQDLVSDKALISKAPKQVLALIYEFDEVFGLRLKDYV